MGQNQRAYDEAVKREIGRELQRRMMYALVEYFEADLDAILSEDAAMVRDTLERVRERRRASDLIGDPLRLNPKHQRIKKEEEKTAAQAKRKGEGPSTPDDELREKTVVHDLGSDKVKVRGHQFRGLTQYQKAAAIKFMNDWETAYERDLGAPGWEPKVDGGRNARTVHIKKLEAQDRLRRLHSELGGESYDLLKAYAVEGIGIDEMARASGLKTVVVTNQVKRAIDSTAVFYGIRNAAGRSRIMEGVDKIRIQRADEIIQAAGRDLDRGRQPTSAGASSSL